jgi:hypothetical protein
MNFYIHWPLDENFNEKTTDNLELVNTSLFLIYSRVASMRISALISRQGFNEVKNCITEVGGRFFK